MTSTIHESWNKEKFRAGLLERVYLAKEKVGHTNKMNPPPAICPRCGQHRSKIWQAVDKERGFWMIEAHCSFCAEEAESAALRLHLRKRYEQAGIPAMFQNWTLRPMVTASGRPRFIPKHFQQNAWSVASKFKTPAWICLSGNPGTGKTTIISSLMCDLIDVDKLNRTFMWTTEYALFRRADLASEQGHAYRVKLLQQVIDTDILFLDDIGGGRRGLTPWQAGAFRDLIDERHREQRPTFFTTNIGGWRELSNRYGEHIVSRMLDASTQIVPVLGPDLRICDDIDEDDNDECD